MLTPMRIPMVVLAIALAVPGAGAPARLAAAELATLQVVVVADSPNPARGQALVAWLRPLVRTVRLVEVPADVPPPAAVLAGDVVLLDWDPPPPPAGAGAADAAWLALAARTPMPLGARAAWHTPTVLLGMAGLLAAEAWQTAGVPGEASLQPFATSLRAGAALWSAPMPVSRTLVMLPAATALPPSVPAQAIAALPLADGPLDRSAPGGWGTDAEDLAQMPEVECWCSGITSQGASAMAVWRQGNLMHVGFRQGPAQLNATGRAVLANAIAAIADVHADRPIAVQALGPDGQPRWPSRAWLSRELLRQAPTGRLPPSLSRWLSPAEVALLTTLSRQPGGIERYCRERLPYLRPDAESGQLVIDAQLQSAGITYDSPGFLPLVVATLGRDPETGAELIQRYVPEVPPGRDSVVQSAWLAAHRPYAFASDAGGYRWYLDALALARGLPSAELRGPARHGPASTAKASAP